MAKALGDWSGPITRLDFDALSEDWEREITRAYTELGLDLSEKALTAMRAVVVKSEAGRHRGHADQLERFSNRP